MTEHTAPVSALSPVSAHSRDGASSLAVMLPNYNHGLYLPHALDALLAQSVQPDVICVVDDGSTDDSVAIIKDYASRFPVIKPVLYPENRGLLRNMSDWLADSRAEFVYFAASDDVVLPDLLEQSLLMLNTFPDAGLCSALTRLIDEQGEDLGTFATPVPAASPSYFDPTDTASILMRHDSWFVGNSTVYRRTALQECGGFDPDLKGFTDGFASRIVALTHGACFIPRPLAAWRRMDAGMAGRTVDDPATMHAVMERATHLMKTKHASVTPPGYCARWRRRWLYGAAVRQLRWRRDEVAPRIDALLPQAARMNMFVISTLLLLPWGWRLAVLGWLAFRLRPFDIVPTIGRRRFRSPKSAAPVSGAPSILHVITGLGLGGAEGALVDLAVSESVPARPLAVAALIAEGPNRSKLESAGVRVIDLGMMRNRPGPVAVIRLARLIRRTRPDILQSWMYHADLVSLLALWLSGRRGKTRLLWSIRCSDMDTRQYKRIFRFVLWAWLRLARFADMVVANSDAGIKVHRDLGMRARQVIRLNNGVDTAKFSPDPDARAKQRKKLCLTDDDVIVAIVGRVDPMKDHELFLYALDAVPGMVGLAAGLGTEDLPARDDLLRLGQRDDIPALLSASDILVSTSRFGEGFSNVIAEAMSCGVPVVATDVGDARRIIGEAGVIVPPGDQAALENALRELVADGAARKRMGQIARKRAEVEFGIDRMLEAFFNLYRVLLSRVSKPPADECRKVAN